MYQSFHSTPTYTMKYRTQTITKSNQLSSFPGPSDYNVTKKTLKAPTYVIGTQKREVFKVNNQNPGPGAYKQKSHIQDGPKRSLSARLDPHVKTTPGPHDYNVQTLKVRNKQPVYSMSTKSKYFNQIVKDNNLYKPAPNVYDPSKGSFSNPKGVIGTSRRKDLTETQKTPGPGAYLTIQQLQKSKLLNSMTNPRCLIGNDQRKTDIKPILDNPGPGTYQRKTFWQQNKDKRNGYTMRPKTADLNAIERAKMPGPGYYESHLKNRNRSPQYGCGTNKRVTFIDNAKRNSTPGAGTHDPQLLKYKSTQTHKFSVSTRRDLDENEKTPGPVQYQKQKLKVMNSVPKYSVGKYGPTLDQFLTPRDFVPGPNVYDPKANLIKQSSKFSEIPHSNRPNFDKAKYTPGPGYYNLRGKQQGPAWGFSQDLRIPFTESKQAFKVPGVGQYQIKQSVPNPPKYMNTSSKINYQSRSKSAKSSRRT